MLQLLLAERLKISPNSRKTTETTEISMTEIAEIDRNFGKMPASETFEIMRNFGDSEILVETLVGTP